MLDFDKYTVAELENIIKLATQEIFKRKSSDLSELKAQIEALVRKSGCTLQEILNYPNVPIQNPPPSDVHANTQTSVQLHQVDNAQAATQTDSAIEPAAEKPLKTLKPKYQDPQHPEHTWTGRGKPPKWLQLELDNGANKEDFLIK